MQDIILRLTRSHAIELINTITVMSGGAQHRLLRARMQQNIQEVWPEVLKAPDPHHLKTEERPVSFSRREMRALAEGFLVLFNHPGQDGLGMSGGEFNALRETCRMCRCWSWVEKQIDEMNKKFPELTDDMLDAPAPAAAPPAEMAPPLGRAMVDDAQGNVRELPDGDSHPVPVREGIWDERPGRPETVES